MKRFFKVLILCFSLILIFGCVKDEKIEKNKLEEDLEIETEIEGEENIDLEEIEKEEEIASQEEISDEENEKKDEGESGLSVKNEKKLIYKDDKYGFSLEIPDSWEGNYVVENEPWIDYVNESVCFKFEGKNVSSEIFTILVIDESILEEEWEDPFLIYITQKDGRTFVYLPALEPSEELLQEKNKEEFDLVIDMVEEVPSIIETIKFEN